MLKWSSVCIAFSLISSVHHSLFDGMFLCNSYVIIFQTVSNSIYLRTLRLVLHMVSNCRMSSRQWIAEDSEGSCHGWTWLNIPECAGRYWGISRRARCGPAFSWLRTRSAGNPRATRRLHRPWRRGFSSRRYVSWNLSSSLCSDRGGRSANAIVRLVTTFLLPWPAALSWEMGE